MILNLFNKIKESNSNKLLMENAKMNKNEFYSLTHLLYLLSSLLSKMTDSDVINKIYKSKKNE